MKTTRTLTAGLALALGLAISPAAAGAVDLTTPTPPPRPPVGADDLSVPRPDLTVEAFDVAEGDGHLLGRLTLSAPLTVDLGVAVTPLLIDIDQWDIGCVDPGDGSCGSYLGVEIPAGETEVDFAVSVWTDDGAEPAERYGFEAVVSQTTLAQQPLVDVGPPGEAVLYDGAGLELGLLEDPEGLEGDAGSDGTLDLVVEANQAVPHPVSFRVSTNAAGGYNAALAGVDHEPVDVVVELPAGETSVAVSVPLIGDDIDEGPQELFFGTLSDLSHGAISLNGGSSVARILDDDQPVVSWKRPGGYQSPSRSARSAALTA